MRWRRFSRAQLGGQFRAAHESRSGARRLCTVSACRRHAAVPNSRVVGIPDDRIEEVDDIHPPAWMVAAGDELESRS